jgi:hypothetical protein
MQHNNVQPEGTTTLALNQMINANFTCECITDGCSQPYWSLENEGKSITTDEPGDKDSLAECGITYGSTGDSTTFITIPDRVENNNTMISCVVIINGGTEFSEPPVELIIIGESE